MNSSKRKRHLTAGAIEYSMFENMKMGTKLAYGFAAMNKAFYRF